MADEAGATAKTTEQTTGDPPSPDNQDSTTLKVYGKDQTFRASVSGEEAEKLVELARKGAAADERWQEAHQLSQKAKEDTERATMALQLQEAVDNLRANPEDMEAFQKVADAFGYDQAATAELANQARKTDPKGKEPAPAAPKVLTDKEKWDQLPKDVREQLKSGFRDRMAGDLKEAVAKDAVLRENVGNESRMSVILEMAQEEATRLMVVGDPDPANRNRTLAYGPEVVRRAVEKARQRIEKLSPHQESDQLPAPGVGRAPAGGQARHPTQPPKRVPMTDPGYGDYFQEKLQYEALKGSKPG